jgi:tol-pal system protein YbgF
MKRLVLGLALIAAGCGSNAAPKPEAAPPDARIAEIQTSMTELLERLDVINARLERLEQSGPQVPSSAAPSASLPSRTNEGPVLQAARIAEIYRSALAAYGRQQYGEARSAFQQVFDADPSSDLADNALFWIGETYFAAGDDVTASRFYQRVLEEYGDQNKAPDALFKLALTHVKSGDLVLARKTLQEVMARYPYSTSAAAAKSELNRIKY